MTMMALSEIFGQILYLILRASKAPCDAIRSSSVGSWSLEKLTRVVVHYYLVVSKNLCSSDGKPACRCREARRSGCSYSSRGRRGLHHGVVLGAHEPDQYDETAYIWTNLIRLLKFCKDMNNDTNLGSPALEARGLTCSYMDLGLQALC
jgi:hypothetical protein